MEEVVSELSQRVASATELAAAAAMPEDMLEDGIQSYLSQSNELPASISPLKPISLRDRESVARLVRKQLDNQLVLPPRESPRSSPAPVIQSPAPVSIKTLPSNSTASVNPLTSSSPGDLLSSTDREELLLQMEKIEMLEADLRDKERRLVEIDKKIQNVITASRGGIETISANIKRLEKELTIIRADLHKTPLGRVLSNTQSAKHDLV